MTEALATILEILKYTVPAIVVLIGTSLIVKRFLISEIERKRMAIFQEGMGKTMMLQLQAYERLSIFVERIHPRSLISRLYQSNLTAQEFQYILLHHIQEEFEHNLSQQIYVSNEVWKTVTAVKEQEMAMVNSVGNSLNPQAPARELSDKIMAYLQNSEASKPVEIALEIINNEAKMILFAGHK